MTAANAYLPGIELQDAVIARVVSPHVEKLMQQGMSALQAELHIYVRGERVASRDVAIPDTARELSPAELRCEFRRTIDPCRSLFLIEVMLGHALEGSGYSGFKIKGELRGKEGTWGAAKATAITDHYNVTTWSRW